MRTFMIVAGLAVVGCGESYQFTVEMRPEGDGLARSISCIQYKDGQTRSSSFPSDMEQRIDALYGSSLQPSVAQGVFRDQLPGEFGGSGFQRTYSNDLGSASIYSERVQPNRSPWEVVEGIDATVDRCVDLLMGWFRWELAELPEFRAAADEIDAELRQELKSLALVLAFPLESSAQPGSEELGGAPLVLHRVLELQLVSLEELPELYRMNRNLDDDEAPGPWLLARLRSSLAQRLAVPIGQPAFAFLDSPEAFDDSWRAWIESGGGQDVPDPPEDGSDPGQAIGALLELSGLDWGISFGREHRSVVTKLATRVEPMATNGSFDPVEGTVSWPEQRLADDGVRPLHRYAVWATPEEEVQRRLFGRVLLSGERLFEYAIWYAGLGVERSREWSELLASVDVHHDVAEQLGKLRFRSRLEDERPDSDRDPGDPPYLTPHGAELLLQALGSE